MRIFGIILLLLLGYTPSLCGKNISEDENITIMGYELKYFVDEDNRLTIDDIYKNPSLFQKFAPETNYAITEHIDANYWVKVDIPFQRMKDKSYMIEAIDSHINYIETWLLSSSDTLYYGASGYLMNFNNKSIAHKNFLYDIPPSFAHDSTSFFLFKIRSKQPIALIFKFRSLRYNLQYSNTEYAWLFFFYGIIFFLALYNLLSFIYLKEKKYLFLFLYIFASGLIATSEDSILFHMLWPNNPALNSFIFTWSIPIYLISINNYLISFLDINTVKSTNRFRLLTIIYFITTKLISFHFDLPKQTIGALYLSYSLVVLFFAIKKSISSNLVIRLITLGFTVAIMGIIPKLDFLREDIIWLLYYFNFGILFQCIVFTFAMIYDYRITKTQKDKIQQQIISELTERRKIIEEEVQERTAHIEKQKKIINQSNQELATAYKKLSEKAEIIDRINIQLKDSNRELENDLKVVKEAHLINHPLNFSEFKNKFNTPEICLQYLSERKWKNGYICKKCGSLTFNMIIKNSSRRCSKCGYVESATTGTIFHRLHFSIEKAFYLIFYIGMMEVEQSNLELATQLNIPANTCWRFSQKIKQRKKELQMGNKTALNRIIFGD